MRILRTTCLVHFLCLSILAIAQIRGAAAQDRSLIFGVGTANGGWTLLDPEGYADRMFDVMSQVGTTSTRIGASWADIEAVRGQYDWMQLDEDVARCLEHNIRPYCLIVNTPAWASPTGEATHEYAPLPAYNTDWENFCTAIAQRYAGQVDDWEVWNEQNGYGWHTDGGFNRVDEYVPLLRMAYYALKAGNPACRVAIGGLDDPDVEPGDPTGWRGANFMRLFYDELNRRGWADETIFDAVADHPYHSREELSDLRYKLRALKAELDYRGDGDKPIWITEYGWTTKSSGMTEQLQADLLTQYLAILLEPEFDYVEMASILAISDMETGYGGWGLTDQDLRPKPAFYAFQSFPRGEAPQVSHVQWKPAARGRIEVTWQTHIPATGWIEYGLTSSYGQLSPTQSSLTTRHTALITGLASGVPYHMRILASAPGVTDGMSADYRIIVPGTELANGDFEQGVPGIADFWRTTAYGFWTDTATLDRVRTGLHGQGVIAIGGMEGRYLNESMYAFATPVVGQPYEFSAWTRIEVDSTTPHVLRRRVGTDPTGGTDPAAASVVWSSPNVLTDAWARQAVSAVAEAPVVTVFVRVDTLIPQDVWLSMYVDDASFSAAPQWIRGDFDRDNDVDTDDRDHFASCMSGAGVEPADAACFAADFDEDNDVDQSDYGILQACYSGSGAPPDPACW